MPEVIKDERQWTVEVILENRECLYLFYPRNIHGCKLLRRRGIDDECNKDTCPLRVKELG
jgi:hypothetical protein